MLGKILISTTIGIIFGTLTGLIPGLHINLICTSLLSISPFLLKISNAFLLSVFIISMSITHTFLDAIPSIFLGAPDEAHCLTILPGHKMLLAGRGKEAVMLTAIGSLFSLIICTLISPLILKIILPTYELFKSKIWIVLLLAIMYLIFSDKKRFSNLTIFFLAGCLGLSVLNNSNLVNPLFPMLSGLFGISTLLTSLENNTKIPIQKRSSIIDAKNIESFKASFLATLFGFIASFLPGFGSSQAAIFASKVMKTSRQEAFLILVGGINTVNMNLSIITLFALQKARNGSVLAISDLMNEITTQQVFIFFLCSIVVGGIAFNLASIISIKFSKLIVKVNYKILISSIILCIVLATFILSNGQGIIVLITSTALGIFTEKLGVARNNCLGCLIVPVLLYLIPF